MQKGLAKNIEKILKMKRQWDKRIVKKHKPKHDEKCEMKMELWRSEVDWKTNLKKIREEIGNVLQIIPKWQSCKILRQSYKAWW